MERSAQLLNIQNIRKGTLLQKMYLSFENTLCYNSRIRLEDIVLFYS